MSKKEPLERRHSHHGHLLPSPAAVIEQLKSKVKRRYSSKNQPFDSADSAAAANWHASNSSSPRSSQDPAEIPSATLPNYLSSTPPTLETIFSYDGTDQEATGNAEILIDSNENGSFGALATNEEEKPSRTKAKALKATKSLPEANPKKRRQTLRRAGFQIPDEDFPLIFSDLPADEQLIISFPGAWRKDVFMHGRMFLSMHYVCFYTCFFKWEESLCIPFTDIASVTRERSAVVLPNAIKIRTKSDEQYLFASHIPREKIFVPIFRLWQNVLLEQPLDFQQLRTLVHANEQTMDEPSGDSDESLSGENATETAERSQSLPEAADFSEKPLAKGNRSSPPDQETVTHLPTCPCEAHLTKAYADQAFTLHVDNLFELLFSDNSFTSNYHAAHNLNEYTYGEWKLNKETGFRERLVTYKTVAQAVIGSNSLTCREKQILKVDQPGCAYVLYSEVNNEGMRYTDRFSVATQFCMIQKNGKHSHLRVSAEIRYIKNVNSLIKSFIEKNAHSSIEEQVNEQVRRLEAQQTTPKSTRKQSSLPKQRSTESISRSPQSIQPQSSTVSLKDQSFTGKGLFYDLLIVIGAFILLLHIYLCYKLYSFDQRIQSPETICLKQCHEQCLLNHGQ